MRNALNHLGERSPEKLPKTYHIHRTFYFSGAGAFENAPTFSLLSSLGEILCGDEKLFRFTGKGGIVRKVPNKPAIVGIWHYQATVMLSNGEPFLEHTRVHGTASNLGESTQTTSIVLGWQIWCRSLIDQP